MEQVFTSLDLILGSESGSPGIKGPSSITPVPGQQSLYNWWGRGIQIMVIKKIGLNNNPELSKSTLPAYKALMKLGEKASNPYILMKSGATEG